MQFDSHKLGYTRRGDTLLVHYPKYDATGALTYGAGIPFDHVPETQRRPDGERTKLWLAMLSEP